MAAPVRLSKLRGALAVVGAATVLVLGADYVAIATTGESLVLGRANTASNQTTLTRTTPGSTLRLDAAPGSAPLAVNRSTRIHRLNADLLDGIDSASLARKTLVHTRRAPICTSVKDLTQQPRKVYTLGTFEKVRAGSAVDLDFGTAVQIADTVSNGVILELRVDQEVADQVVVREGATHIPIRLAGTVQGLDAGQRSVELWARADFGVVEGNTTVDPYCYGNSHPHYNDVQIREFS